MRIVKITIGLFLCFTMCYNMAIAGTSISFIENLGQWDHPGKFKADIPGGVLFLSGKGFVYHFSRQQEMGCSHKQHNHNEHDATITVDHHAYLVHFIGCNDHAVYMPADKRDYYHNYFMGNDRNRWKGNVGLYGKVVQKDIYDGIDMVVYSGEHTVKYDFVISAGADPQQIILGFEGVSPVLDNEGNLVLSTSLNEVVEKAPYCYQLIDGREVVVRSRYKMNKRGEVCFEFPDGYNTAYPLIVDPVLVFATYSSATGTADYFSYSSTYDKQGNLYAGGQASNVGTGWPATTGAFQTRHNGRADVVINKYNHSGSDIIFSTYYGGISDEFPNAMIVNDQNELIVVGNTLSADLPVTEGCYDSTLDIGRDLFIARFNHSGSELLGATYMGGGGHELVAISMNGGTNSGVSGQNLTSAIEVNCDHNGNIWVISSSGSRDFPVSNNAYQQTYGGGISDVVLFQLDPSCSNLLYSTYIGGGSTDAGFGIQFNRENNIVICGATLSNNFPATTGVLNPQALGGGSDGFVSIIDPVTGNLLYSTYLGTDNLDQAVNLQIDNANQVYVLGRTMGDYSVSPGVYHMAGTDVFIDVLSPDLSRSLHSTRLGISQSETKRYFPSSFLLDICGNVYVAGMGNSSVSNTAAAILPTGLPTTGDAFEHTAKDFWFVVLRPDFSNLLFGSYFGSGENDHTHMGVHRMDPDGVIYQSICAGSANYPVTPGAVATSKSNSGQDIVSFKINFQLSGVRSSIGLADNQIAEGCAPYTVQFQNNSRSPYSMDFTWDFGDGTPQSTLSNPSHTFSRPGIYTVVLHARSDSACKTDDYDTLIITVRTVEAPVIQTADTLVCSGTNEIPLWVEVTNPQEVTYQWEPVTGILSDARKPVITVNPSLNTTYTVTVTNHSGICSRSVTDTVRVHFYPRSLTLHTPDTAVCEGAEIEIRAESTPGYSYYWSPVTGVSDTSVLEPLITVTQPQLYQLTASYPGCPDTVLLLDIDMQAVPRLKITPSQAVCAGTLIALGSEVSPYRKDYHYTWTPGEKLSHPHSPNTSFTADSTITCYLEVATPIGCTARDSVRITVYPGDFASVIADTGYCPGRAVTLWAEGGITYTWTPSYGLNDSSIARPMASPATTTQYRVYVTSAQGCVDTQEVWVIAYPEAVINMPDSITLYPGEQYHLKPISNAHYYQWFPPSGISSTDIANPVVYPEVRTRYYVTATTEHGCVVNDSIDILVAGTLLDIPNAFRPGAFTFKPAKRGIASMIRFEVYNRWGNRVFDADNIDEGWDGTYKGVAQPMGVYLYIFEGVLDNGRIVSRQGNVTLLR